VPSKRSPALLVFEPMALEIRVEREVPAGTIRGDGGGVRAGGTGAGAGVAGVADEDGAGAALVADCQAEVPPVPSLAQAFCTRSGTSKVKMRFPGQMRREVDSWS